MLTRIEVDGFKNLLGFSAEFGPFTCIAGPNAVGKSNLFDAIEFLSLLAEYPLEEAAEKVRETSGSVESARRLFWTNGKARAETVAISAEMIVPAEVFDDLGVPAAPDDVCVRYEVELRWEDGLRLTSERLRTLGGSLEDHLRFPHAPTYASAYGNKAGAASPSLIYDIQRGQLPGKHQPQFDPGKARRTVLSQYTTADHPVLLSVNRELKSWRRFALDPASLRTPDTTGSHREFNARGLHLPGQIRKLTDPHRSPAYHEAELSALLSTSLGPVADLRGIWVEDDPNTGLMSLRAKLGNGEEVSARELSDGTLRYLALATLELNCEPGVFCIEEPENGIHPRQFADVYGLLTAIATNPSDPAFAEMDPDEQTPPLRQVIVNTHSSELVAEVYRHSPEDLLLASPILTTRADGGTARVLRLHPIHGTWRCSETTRGVNLPVADYVGAAIRPWQHAGVAEDK